MDGLLISARVRAQWKAIVVSILKEQATTLEAVSHLIRITKFEW
jgi:hypothetical protein